MNSKIICAEIFTVCKLILLCYYANKTFGNVLHCVSHTLKRTLTGSRWVPGESRSESTSAAPCSHKYSTTITAQPQNDAL